MELVTVVRAVTVVVVVFVLTDKHEHASEACASAYDCRHLGVGTAGIFPRLIAFEPDETTAQLRIVSKNL